MNFKKSDIAKSIFLKTDISYSLSKNIIDSFIELIKFKSNSRDVKIASFGTFTNKVSPQRIGRNPKTGEEYVINERVKLNFIDSNKVKAQLN